MAPLTTSKNTSFRPGTKYELSWQVTGVWRSAAFAHYSDLQLPELRYFLCALHAPLDSIVLKGIANIRLGKWLQERGLQKPNGYLLESCTGSFRPWSKLDCLRTYYGLQLMLRRIAMETWPEGCACTADADAAIQKCANWFNQKYGASSNCNGKDWVQAACDLGKEVGVIEETLAVLRVASTSVDATPLHTKSEGPPPHVVSKQSHKQSDPIKAVQGGSPLVHLEEGPSGYIKVVDACGHGNDGMICLHKNPHLWLKNQNASPRYLIGEILGAGGDFAAEVSYAVAPGGVPNCGVGGQNYQGGVRFDSDVGAVKYLKRFFTVMACSGNQQFDQAWVDNC